MIDAVRAEIDARADAALEVQNRNRAKDLVGRLVMWDSAVEARMDNRLAAYLDFMQLYRTRKTVFCVMDDLLGVHRPSWWQCWRRGQRVYAEFTDDQLMNALAASLLKN